MTLREWCQREGHPFTHEVHALGTHPLFPSLRLVGRACACGRRHDPMPDGRALRVLVPEAVDREGTDRTAGA